MGPVAVAAGTREQAVEVIWNWAVASRASGRSVHFCNAYSLALADSDHGYARCLNAGDLTCADGVPVVWAQRWLHGLHESRARRVYGPDVMADMFSRSDQFGVKGPRHYLLGGTPSALDALRTSIERKWPGAQIAGSESPSFNPPTDADLAQRDARILASGARVVWVGLGTPKQDYEARRLALSLPVVALAVGAAFDFISGSKPQAPGWMQRSGTEWVFRLASEPRRLAHRYLWGNPRFVVSVVRQRINNATTHTSG